MRKSHSILLLIAILISISTAALADSATPAPAGVVNINTADATQLSYLPRVGAKVAQRIVDYRKEHGPFKKTSDLMQVKGFGEKSFERISPYLTVDGKTTLTEKVHLARKARAPRQTSAAQPTN